MSQKDDKVFIKKFSTIIVGLVIVTVVIIALAFSLRSTPDPDANPSHQRLTEERIAPVAGVRTGADDLAQLASEESKAVAAATEPAAAAEEVKGGSGSEKGKEVYESVCTACHAAGVAGAPVPGSELMAQRLAEKGTDGLVDSVINGLNVMPPRGGRTDLSDEDIQAAVEYMLAE